jgi:hypothetical protein
MKWLSRLKEMEATHESGPTKTTKSVSVVSVAPVEAPIQKTGGGSEAADDVVIQIPTQLTDDFMARLNQFTSRGVNHPQAEALAALLTNPDRGGDDRRLCLECQHLTGYATGSWRCNNWSQAGVAIRAQDAGIPHDLVCQLQRCSGFKA